MARTAFALCCITVSDWLQPLPCVVLQFLIGYNRGLIVLWDNKENNADQTYNASQVKTCPFISITDQTSRCNTLLLCTAYCTVHIAELITTWQDYLLYYNGFRVTFTTFPRKLGVVSVVEAF